MFLGKIWEKNFGVKKFATTHDLNLLFRMKMLARNLRFLHEIRYSGVRNLATLPPGQKNLYGHENLKKVATHTR